MGNFSYNANYQNFGGLTGNPVVLWANLFWALNSTHLEMNIWKIGTFLCVIGTLSVFSIIRKLNMQKYKLLGRFLKL